MVAKDLAAGVGTSIISMRLPPHSRSSARPSIRESMVRRAGAGAPGGTNAGTLMPSLPPTAAKLMGDS